MSWSKFVVLLCTVTAHHCEAASFAPVQQPILPVYDANERSTAAVGGSAFDAFVNDIIKEFHVPGLSVAIVDGANLSSKGYGYAVLPDQEATADTQFFTGSTTKAFTAAAAARLVHDNDNYPEFKWTSPINNFIRSDFVLENDYATTHTTIEDALSHRSGLPRHDLSYGGPDDNAASITRRIRDLPLTAEPRTRFQYCNIMFGVMTHVLETLTGSKMEDILHDNFWKPLGMRSTTFDVKSTLSGCSRLARGYYWNTTDSDDATGSHKGNYVPDPYIDILPISGAGATISTVNDYALWMKAFLDAAKGEKDSAHNKSSPITSAMVRDLFSPRTIILDAADQENSTLPITGTYGLGWLLIDLYGTRVVYHSGGLTGFGTQLYLLPDLGYGIVTMGNTAGTSNEAGAVIASKLIADKISASTARAASEADVRTSLLSIHHTLSGDAPAKRRKHYSRRARQHPQLQADFISPAVDIEIFAGMYTHPAYGNLNITLSSKQDVSANANQVLEVLLYSRMWPNQIRLSHVNGNHFHAKYFAPHGLGNITTGEGIAWEFLDDAVATFESNLSGEIDRFGLEIEDEMVDAAEEKGQKYWREGLIWFDKV